MQLSVTVLGLIYIIYRPSRSCITVGSFSFFSSPGTSLISVLLSLALFESETLGSPRNPCVQSSQPHQWYLRGPTICSHSKTVICNAMVCSVEREIFPSTLVAFFLFLEPRVEYLSSKVMTYLLLSSVHIFSWPHTSSMPSGWPWHTHRTSSLSSLLTKIAVQRDSRVGQTFYIKSSRKSHFTFNNFPVHFTLDPSWCLYHNYGI